MRNHGIVRGGSNERGRLFLAIRVPTDASEAITEGLRASFLVPEHRWNCEKTDAIYAAPSGDSDANIYVRINTRRGFSLVPAIVRWAESAGWPLRVAHWDGDAKNSAAYPSAEFFEVIASAACFYSPR